MGDVTAHFCTSHPKVSLDELLKEIYINTRFNSHTLKL